MVVVREMKGGLFNTKVNKLKILESNRAKDVLTNLLSYIYVRVNYKFDHKFNKFIKYDKFLSNDNDAGMLGIVPNHDYSKKPMDSDDYFQRREIKNK